MPWSRFQLQLSPATRRLAGWCLALVLTVGLFLFLASGLTSHLTSPPSATALKGRLTLQVDAGFNSRYRNGNWIPVHITLYNNGPDFSGTLATSNPPGPISQTSFTTVPASTYQLPVTLPHRTQKQVTLYLPIYTLPSVTSLSVQLLDHRGNVLQSQSASLQALNSQDVFVGLLSDQEAGFGGLQTLSLPNQSGSVVVQFLNAQTMPHMTAVLDNFNIIVLDAFTTSRLTYQQLMALQTWVNQGGALIEIAGAQWQQTLSPLPADLLPVRVQGISTLPAGTHLLPIGGSTAGNSGSVAADDTIAAPVTVSAATVQAGAQTILSSSSTPLLVQAHQGQGSICYLAFDPTLEPIVGWPGVTALWKDLLLRSLGEQLLPADFGPGPSFGASYSLAKLQHLLFTTRAPTPLVLLLLFLGYLLALGPARWLIMRRLKQPTWSWRIILSAIVIFSLLDYGTALYQQGTSMLGNSFSIIQLNRGGAHSTSYVNVYMPFVSANGDVQVHLPNGILVQPFAETSQQQEGATITASPDEETQVNVTGDSLRTLNALQVEQDIPVQGAIVSHLALKQGTLVGTVTNTLSTALSDVYILLPQNFVRIGALGAGQTSNIKLTLPVSPASGSLPSCTSLANQIAADSGGLPVKYDFLFARSVQQSLNERQRHVSLLVFLMNSLRCGDTSLRATGSFATLVGWAAQPLDGVNDVTFNGIHPGGLHETMLVAGLSITYAAGSLILPPDVLPGYLVDADAVSIRHLSTISYAVESGQMTFEYSVPDPAHLDARAITLTQLVDSSTSPYMTPGGSPGNSVYLSLYNWQTHSWRMITLTPSVPFTTQNTKAYLGPGGRILVQCVNRASELAIAAFTKPTLTITGSIASS